MRPFEQASPQIIRHLRRIGVSLWLILWVLTLPLFHIHTTAEARQGVAHTVFSPDLPGEYSGGLPETVRSKSTNPSHRHDSLRNGQSYPELAFTTPLPQVGKSHKPFHNDVYGALNLVENLGATLRCPLSYISKSDASWFPDSLSPRAPPRPN